MKYDETIRYLKERMDENYDYESLSFRTKIYREVYRDNPQDSRPVQTAKAFRRFLEQKPVVLHEYDVFAGVIQHYDVSASLPISYPSDYDPKVRPTYTRVNDLKREKEACIAVSQADKEQKELLDMLESGVDSGLFSHCPYGHVIPDFGFVLENGLDRIRERICRRRSKTRGDQAKEKSRETMDHTANLEAFEVVVEAVGGYAMRYAGTAQELGRRCVNEEYRRSLLNIQRACHKMAHEPAQTFYEALQYVLILQELLVTETASGSMSLGRMDQLLYPYYQADLEAGRIDALRARFYIDAWRTKLAGLVQGFQNLTLCGCDAQGRFCGNEVSLMIMESTVQYRFDQPLLSLRYSEDMPEAYWEAALKIIELGDGFPAIFNDAIIREALEKSGVDRKDSWNYGIVGCVEPSICGKEFSNTEEMRLNWAKVLELMFHNGKCSVTGHSYRLFKERALGTITDFESFVNWYEEELIHFLRQAAKACDLIDASYYKAYPSPLLSLMVRECLDKAEDVAALGPVYRFSTINNCAMANAVDSLLAVKELVYEKKKLSLEKFKEVLDGDFQGYEDIRAYIINHCEKYGNDSYCANQLMTRLVNTVSSTIQSISNCRGFHFRSGMYTVDLHASMGMLTGATPDGRRAGTSLSNAISPVQGADQKGPTSIINAATCFSHTQFGNGMVLDLKFSPSVFQKATSRSAFRAMLSTYFQQGGMEIQFNIMNRETLLAAQREPEKYRNLIVRVSGFSAYFVNLYKTLQDEIIARTEYEQL